MRFPASPVPFMLAALLGILAVIAYIEVGAPGSVASAAPTTFSSNGKTFTITYTATDNAQRQQGLMNRKVTNSTIMLFVFPSPGYHQFWMYDTNTSLDMIWVEVNGTIGRVVYIVASAQPCFASSSCTTFSPSAPASYVLEAKAGFAEANDIHVGSMLHFG